MLGIGIKSAAFFLIMGWALMGWAAQNGKEKPPLRSAKAARQAYDVLKPAAMALLDSFTPAIYAHSDGRQLPYRLFSPASATADRRYPLVVFLHGMGGKGTDNRKQMTDQIVCPSLFALPGNQKVHPCYVLAPQSKGFGSFMCWTTEIVPMVKALVDRLVKEKAIDPHRIYVTGISMGGYGTWNLAGAYPDFFAAAVPVCGKGDTARAAAMVRHKLPVWAFHGAQDTVVKPAGSRNMVAALQKAGGAPRYTEYPDAGHASWEGAYTEPGLLPWLFAQRKPADQR